jgi:hypothetical protein
MKWRRRFAATTKIMPVLSLTRIEAFSYLSGMDLSLRLVPQFWAMHPVGLFNASQYIEVIPSQRCAG